MKILMIFCQILGVLTLIPWLIGLFMSPMAFDSPDSTKQWFPYLFIGALLAYPVVIGVMYYLSWHFFNLDNQNLAVFLSLLPILCILMLVGYLALA